MLEELAAVDDLADRLVEGHHLPLVLAPLAGALEHLDDAVGIVERLDAGLPFGTDLAVDLGRLERVGCVIELRQHAHRAVGVAVDLDQNAVEYLPLDGAAGVALQADAVENVLGFGEQILLSGFERAGLGPLHQPHGPLNLGGDQRRAAQKGSALQDSAT